VAELAEATFLALLLTQILSTLITYYWENEGNLSPKRDVFLIFLGFKLGFSDLFAINMIRLNPLL
jgi:hypothetical protein